MLYTVNGIFYSTAFCPPFGKEFTGTGGETSADISIWGVWDMKKKPVSLPVYPEHKIIEKALLVTACVLAVWTGLLSLLKYFVSNIAAFSPASAVLRYLLLALAAGYVIFPLFKGREGKKLTALILKEYFSADQILLLVFFLWSLFGISSMNSTYKGDWSSYNKNYTIDCMLTLLVFFPLGRRFGRKGVPAALKWVLFGLVLVLTVFMGYILYTVCKPALLILPNGFEIGMNSASRLCIHCNPNTTGMLSTTVLGVCLLGGFFSKGPARVLWFLMAPVHFFILVLSDSRSAYISGAVVLAGILACVFYSRSKKKDWKTFVIAVALFAVSGLAVMLIKKPCQALYERISHLKELKGWVGVGREVDALDSNGRTDIYKYSLQVIVADTRSFFFGNTTAGVVPMLEKISEGKLDGLYTHNQFLEVAVSTGVPGFLLFVFWEVRQAVRSVKLFIEKRDVIGAAARLVPFAMLMFVVGNLAEATLLWYGYLNGYLLFLLCGWLHGKEEELNSL